MTKHNEVTNTLAAMCFSNLSRRVKTHCNVSMNMGKGLETEQCILLARTVAGRTALAAAESGLVQLRRPAGNIGAASWTQHPEALAKMWCLRAQRAPQLVRRH